MALGSTPPFARLHESFPEKKRPVYATVQTTGYRVESKKAVRRVKKVGNFHILEAAVARDAAQRRLIDDLLALLGARLTTGARIMFGGREGLTAQGTPIAKLVRHMSFQLGGTVIDKTGLMGEHDRTLK